MILCVEWCEMTIVEKYFLQTPLNFHSYFFFFFMMIPLIGLKLKHVSLPHTSHQTTTRTNSLPVVLLMLLHYLFIIIKFHS